MTEKRKSYTLRLPEHLQEYLEAKSDDMGVSMNAYIIFILEEQYRAEEELTKRMLDKASMRD